MRTLVAVMSVTLAGLLLTGCDPVYKTQYAYVPPAKMKGKMCVSQCQQTRMMCEQLNETKEQSCLSRARQDAMYKYEIYRLEREKKNLPVDRSVASFENTWGCDSGASDCTASYNACYSGCGGDVLEKQVCTAFCGDNN